LAILLSFYWSFVLFSDWQANPIQTTIATSAMDIKNVPFPSVTICSHGFNQKAIIAHLKNLFDAVVQNCLSKVGI